MPFFALAMSQIAASHLSRLMGESSKIVPTLTLNCFLQPLHFQTYRVLRYECSVPPHAGQTGPSGQRRRATYWTQTSGSEKCRTACMRVVGFFSLTLRGVYYLLPG